MGENRKALRREGIPLRVAVLLWGVLGVVALCAQAIVRLAPRALEPILDGSLGALEWSLLGGWVLVNAYAEGYRGFQKAFAPRVVARALHLSKDPRPLRVLLAPLFCMALFAATRKRLIVSWVLLVTIALLVLGMQFVPQPWRGIVDGGVVVGLGWGVAALIGHLLYALAGGSVSVPAEVRD